MLTIITRPFDADQLAKARRGVINFPQKNIYHTQKELLRWLRQNVNPD